MPSAWDTVLSLSFALCYILVGSRTLVSATPLFPLRAQDQSF